MRFNLVLFLFGDQHLFPLHLPLCHSLVPYLSIAAIERAKIALLSAQQNSAAPQLDAY
jgi:hypothetical protein